MVNLTLEEWQRQSSLLLQARPTTTRIVTKYNVPNLESAKYRNTKKRKSEPEADGKDAAPRIPKATLTLKTFDPESGVVLQFKTDRAADVGRLIAGLGRLGRHMAALPEKTEDVVMHDASLPTKEDSAQADASQSTDAAGAAVGKPQQQQATTKKKKKGKR